MLSYAQNDLKRFTALAVKTIAKVWISRQYTTMQRRQQKLKLTVLLVHILPILDFIVLSSMHGGGYQFAIFFIIASRSWVSMLDLCTYLRLAGELEMLSNTNNAPCASLFSGKPMLNWFDLQLMGWCWPFGVIEMSDWNSFHVKYTDGNRRLAWKRHGFRGFQHTTSVFLRRCINHRKIPIRYHFVIIICKYSVRFT